MTTRLERIEAHDREMMAKGAEMARTLAIKRLGGKENVPDFLLSLPDDIRTEKKDKLWKTKQY